MVLRGTTPVLQFKVPFKKDEVELVWVTFSQGTTIPPKEILTITQFDAEFDMEDNLVLISLSQEDTLLFAKAGTPSVSVQMRIRKPDGTALASNILKFSIGMILKNGVIQ